MKREPWLVFLMFVGIILLVVSRGWTPELEDDLKAAIFGASGNKEVELFGSVQLKAAGKRGLKLECYCICKCKDRDGDGVMECDHCWCRNCKEKEIEATETAGPTWTPEPPEPTTTFVPYPLPTWPVMTPYP